MKRSNDDVAAPISTTKPVFLTTAHHEQSALQRHQKDVANQKRRHEQILSHNHSFNPKPLKYVNKLSFYRKLRRIIIMGIRERELMMMKNNEYVYFKVTAFVHQFLDKFLYK